jgi:hypothetical protein
MNKKFRLMFLALFLAAQSTILVNVACAQEPNGCDSCSVVQQAMQSLERLHNGSTRKEVERDFQPDGGVQAGDWTRYVFRKCSLIKVEVRFVGDSPDSHAEFLQTDTVVSISRPYLDLPFAD